MTASRLPDAKHILRSHAWDIAEEFLGDIKAAGGRWGLFVDPDGEWTFARGIRLAKRAAHLPDSLVGVYDRDASVAAIADDILAMERVL